MSFTASATCCTPSPRCSSLKMLICEALKNGRAAARCWRTSRRLTGSHITIGAQARAVVALRWAATSSVWNCDLPELLEAHHVLHPQEHRLHGLEVRRDVVDVRRSRSGCRRRAARRSGTKPGKRALVAVALDEAEGGVTERRGDGELRQLAAVVVGVALDVVDEGAAALLEQAERLARCPRPRRRACRPRPGACAGSARRGRPRPPAGCTPARTLPAWKTADFCWPSSRAPASDTPSRRSPARPRRSAGCARGRARTSGRSRAP